MPRQRSNGQGTLFRETRPEPIPEGWTTFCDHDGQHGRRGTWYATGKTAYCGSRRYRLNKTRDSILIPTGPWIASWTDHNGKRPEVSTGTTDRQTAERILAKHVAEAALRRSGVIDAKLDRYSTEARRPLAEHVAEYIAHCQHAGQEARGLFQKRRHLEKLLATTGATRLSDLTPDVVEGWLASLSDKGLSACTSNRYRESVVSLLGWCCRTRRIESNPLNVIPRQDQERDRRYVRRPLTDDELDRLLAVAAEHGREAWYLAAALAGLRRGDLIRLTWADVDFEAGTITIRDGKAKRTDVIPLHEQLAEVLLARRDAARALPMAKVFPVPVKHETRQHDFCRAGLARFEPELGKNGELVWVGRGKHRRIKTRFACEDAEGRVVDLHALRTTLGTRLARSGTAPQVARELMRHADYETTLKHYTVLGLSDTRGAMAKLPRIGGAQAAEAAATGTDGKTDPPLYPPQRSGEMLRDAAERREAVGFSGDTVGDRKSLNVGDIDGLMRHVAAHCENDVKPQQNRETQSTCLIPVRR